MKKQLIIISLMLLVPFAVWAQRYDAQQPSYGAVTPSVTFRSTSGTYMSSGSTYSSAVFEIGSSSPSSAPASGPRKGPPSVTPGTPSDDYDPNNPTLPLGDALLPLMLMALAYMVIRVRRKRQVADN
jgi:hypothetical protein